MTLGKYGVPSLILVNIDGCMDTAPPRYITDRYNRTFEVQFFVLRKKGEPIKHMVVCCNLGERWVLYDSNPGVPPNTDFCFDSPDFKNHYSVYLAAYVNITQPGHSA
ncbi:hypothetical protein NFI96_025885, partial [Prochilodus magdalenae]